MTNRGDPGGERRAEQEGVDERAKYITDHNSFREHSSRKFAATVDRFATRRCIARKSRAGAIVMTTIVPAILRTEFARHSGVVSRANSILLVISIPIERHHEEEQLRTAPSAVAPR